MAAYLLSLQRLASLRRRRLREGSARAAANVASGGSRAPVWRAENGRFAKGRAETSAPSEVPKGAGGFSSVQELLDVPKEPIEEWLRACGGSEARVLLAMLCRLASLEARLSELEDRTCGIRSLTANSLSAAVKLASNREPVKSDLLGQVFQKNLSLREMG